MKLKKLLLATSAMMIGVSSAAQNNSSTLNASKPTPAQRFHVSAPLEQRVDHHDHGIPDDKSYRAPTSKLIKSDSQLSSVSKLSINAKALAAACDVNAFATSNTSNLINAITTQGAGCVNDLFSASSSVQISAFSSDNMYAVANHTKSLANAYTGSGDPTLEAMYLFIRAGYFAEYYNDSITFVSWVKPAAKGAIDAFVNNSNFYNNNDEHGKVLQEVIISMDSTEQQDVYLPVVKEWLSRWNQSYAASWNMRSAVNGVFTILFRGQYNTNFVSLVGSDTTLVSRLRSFAESDWMVDSEAEYLIANAARELGRLKLYTGTSIQSSVDSALNSIFNSKGYKIYGYGDAVWLGAADTASYYGNCADYGICGYGEQLVSLALSQTHICSPTIKIRAQNMTSAQFASACDKMGYEETYFHNKLQTNNNPVADDNNSQLQVNIFDSSTDYGKYGGPIFGINTNNGGMYLEGDPATPGNIPNFVAYEASYANPDHFVWNLEHEYVHYLDGRFDLYGGFNAPTETIVWWSEGVAEYVANQDDNQAAIDTINDGSTYALGTVFETTYDGFDQDRIYRWGYLAVRFMFERHQNEVNAMLASTRSGDWTAYKSRINTWASSYANEFTQWTQDLANGTGGNNAPTANANGPYSAAVNAQINFSSNGSVDSDGSISSYNWNFGDGNSSNQANPTHSYSTEGSYTAVLTVTDNEGLSSSASANVTISNVADTGTRISNGETVSGLSGSAGGSSLYYIDVPTNASDLAISISGGSGDADLYVRFGEQPSDSQFDCRPYIGGNNENCSVATPAEGRWYINIKGYSAFSGVSLTASFASSVNELPIAATNGPFSANVNEMVNFEASASYDPDGTIDSYAWDFGDGNTSVDANPSHQYSAAGSYNVVLTVTDNAGDSASTTTTATISTVQPSNELTNGTAVSIAGNQGEETVYTLEVPQGAGDLSFNIQGGTGDADLYVKFGSAPTTNDYDCRPYLSGNNESCDIAQPQVGTYYVLIRGYSAYQTSLTGQFTTSSGNVPNACATETPITSGRLYPEQVTCLGTQSVIWLSLADVSGHNSIAISSGNGTGDLSIEYSNQGWPTNTNVDASSNNSGNGECIYLTGQSQYWGYLKISGEATGASIVLDFDTAGCR